MNDPPFIRLGSPGLSDYMPEVWREMLDIPVKGLPFHWNADHEVFSAFSSISLSMPTNYFLRKFIKEWSPFR